MKDLCPFILYMAVKCDVNFGTNKIYHMLLTILLDIYSDKCLYIKLSQVIFMSYISLSQAASKYKSHISSLSSKLISKMQILSFLILYLYWTTLYMYHLSKIKLTQVVVYTVENSICDSDAYGWLLMIN